MVGVNGSYLIPRLDITDVPPGTYQLRITMNPSRTFMESSFENNIGYATVFITADTKTTTAGEDDLSSSAIYQMSWLLALLILFM